MHKQKQENDGNAFQLGLNNNNKKRATYKVKDMVNSLMNDRNHEGCKYKSNWLLPASSTPYKYIKRKSMISGTIAA